MDFPNSVTLKNLEKTYKNYKSVCAVWQTIDDLVIGGSRIKTCAEKYLKMIPGEDPKIYQKRLEKFTYDNVIGGAISELTRKLSTGTINILNLPETENNVFFNFWNKFRKNLNKGDTQKLSEKKFIERVFQYLVDYGLIYLHIEQEGESTNSVAQNLQLGLTPYVNIYHPSRVTDKGVKDGEKWYKLKFIESYEDPFDSKLKDLHEISWLYISDVNIAEYKGIFEVNKNGEITGQLVNNTIIPIMPDTSVALSEPGIIFHGQPDNPIIEYKVEDQYWLSNNAYLRQLEHLRELNSKHDINTMLYIQRTFKPREKKEDDLEFVTDEVDSGISSGNPYILDVENFSFNEPSGSSSKTLFESLENISSDIRRIYGLGPKETTKGALERSGASKEIDFITVRDILENVGISIVYLMNEVYNRIGVIIGYNREILVTGLDNFQVSLLGNDVDVALKVQDIETSVSPTALTLFYQRLSHELSPSATPKQKTMIDQEVENIFSASISLSRGDLTSDNEDSNQNER